MTCKNLHSNTCWCVCAGGFKVNQLPASPFEGARHPPAASASNSNDAPSNGPFGSCLANMSHSMDTTNSNSGGLHSGTQGDRERDRDRPATFRGLPASSSQQEVNRSPKGRESPFETLRQQQQQQVSCLPSLYSYNMNTVQVLSIAKQHNLILSLKAGVGWDQSCITCPPNALEAQPFFCSRHRHTLLLTAVVLSRATGLLTTQAPL